ncbi:MAG TPA: hypothetical protein VFV05_25080 [Methylomirabilota bacterium]|nr:hypothetical protein [Methylomirabilota bacterium]
MRPAVTFSGAAFAVNGKAESEIIQPTAKLSRIADGLDDLDRARRP